MKIAAQRERRSGLYYSTMWRKLKPYIDVEVYDRDGGHRRPRVRFEVNAPLKKLLAFANTKLHCVACGRLVPFVRARASVRSGGGHFYLAVTCPLTTSFACARSGAARDEYKRIKLALRPDLAGGSVKRLARKCKPGCGKRCPHLGKPWCLHEKGELWWCSKRCRDAHEAKQKKSGQKVGSPSVKKQLDLWITSKGRG